MKQRLLFALSLSMAIAMAGCSWMPAKEKGLTPPLVQPLQENFKTSVAKREDLQKVVGGTGTFEARSPSIAQVTGDGGRIEEILVKTGQDVKKGDVLVRVNFEELDLRLKEAELELERSKKALSDARDGDEQARKVAGLNYEINKIKYEDILGRYRVKELVSAVDGEVIYVEIMNEGDRIPPYKPIVMVADPSKVVLSLNVTDSSNLELIELGMPVEMDYKNESYTGKVAQTPSSAPVSRDGGDEQAAPVIIKMDSLPPETPIGSALVAQVIVAERKNVVQIPRDALRSFLSRNFVRVLNPDKTTVEVDVQSGIFNSQNVEIIKGLEDGQVIIE